MRRVTNYLRILGCIGLLAGLVSCMPSGKEAAALLWPEIENSYVATTKQWTRTDTVYDGVNLEISAAATIKSYQWRQAYADHEADIYGATEQERSKYLSDQMDAHRNGTGVVLSLASPRYGNTRLSLHDSRWKVFAMQGANKIYPIEIRLMEKDIWPFPKLKAAFPYATRWRKFYEVSFEPMAPGPVNVVVTGPAGRMELKWEYFE